MENSSAVFHEQSRFNYKMLYKVGRIRGRNPKIWDYYLFPTGYLISSVTT